MEERPALGVAKENRFRTAPQPLVALEQIVKLQKLTLPAETIGQYFQARRIGFADALPAAVARRFAVAGQALRQPGRYVSLPVQQVGVERHLMRHLMHDGG